MGWRLTASRGRLSYQKGLCWALGARITQCMCHHGDTWGGWWEGFPGECQHGGLGGALPSSRVSSLRLPFAGGPWRAAAAPCVAPALQLRTRSPALSGAEAGQHLTINGESSWAGKRAFRGWRRGPWLQGWDLGSRMGAPCL